MPEELVYASNATMVGLCGGADFSIPDAEAVLPRNMCPLIKSFFGFKVGGTCPYFQSCDMVVGETTCDGKKKTYEILNYYVPTYIMEIPHRVDTPQAKALWLAEVKQFRAKMEAMTGKAIEKEDLKEAIRLINAKRSRNEEGGQSEEGLAHAHQRPRRPARQPGELLRRRPKVHTEGERAGRRAGAAQ